MYIAYSCAQTRGCPYVIKTATIDLQRTMYNSNQTGTELGKSAANH